MVYSTVRLPDGETATLDSVFAALAHHSRRQILQYLATQPSAPRMNVVATDNELSPQLLNKHAAVLEKAGLVSRVKHGRRRHLVLHPEALSDAQQWMRETRAFWEHQLDSLEAYISQLNARTGPDTDREAGTS